MSKESTNVVYHINKVQASYNHPNASEKHFLNKTNNFL